MPSGYEKSPDYGGPEPSWRETIAMLIAIATIVGVLYGLRRLLVAWGLVWS